jgi:HEAT repeat protein
VYPPSWAHEQGDPTNCVLAAGQAQDPASLRVAFSSPHDRVRWAAASNPCLPVDLLRRLLQDPDPDVARAAADNPGTPRPLRAMWQLTQ